MRTTDITRRLAGLGGAKWDVHMQARALSAEGRDIIELTIGEPDEPIPPALVDRAVESMRAGRIGYSNGRGERPLTQALARRYSERTGRDITPDNIMCFPGTQTSLFAVMMGLAQAGDEVIVGDPMYATYEGVIRATGADLVPVPLDPAAGFRIRPADIAARITPRSRVILLNSPHNPTGAVLSRDGIRAIAELAVAHDLAVVADEVYEELVFDGTPFHSVLSEPLLNDRAVVVGSISKSHAAPGFRSGWAVGPADFTRALLPFSETMLFGNQPFIADMTALAVSAPSPIAGIMRARFAARAARLRDGIGVQSPLHVHVPEAGMFALIDVRATGMSGKEYALDLLHNAGVAVMPGESFGTGLSGWVRVALTVPDADIDRAAGRIIAHADSVVPARRAS